MTQPLATDLIEYVQRVTELVPGPQLAPESFDVADGDEFVSAFEVDAAVLTAAAAVNMAFGVSAVARQRLLALCAGQAMVDGTPSPVWADLSGYYDTADDRHVQLHANFPHHAAGIVAALECDADRESVASAIRNWAADDLEARLIDDGLVAAKLRTLDEWNAHPHALATRHLPLISVEQVGDGAPRESDRRLRVLDCSRVLAGPVAGLMFAAHDADVLRIGSRHLPSVEIGVLTTGSGKRNAFVELDEPAGRATFADLLGGADVWIDAYRPGALESRGFAAGAAPEGSVTVQISAFDWVGPWAGRRGYDSIVQSTTGIVRAGTEAAGSDQRVPLPVQALDYCTGLLAAFAARQLVAHQAEVGGTWLARLSLLRTRNWLVGLGGPHPFEPQRVAVADAAMHTVATPFGEVTTALPISGEWSHGPRPLGADEPGWL